jgi:hypothetical protein
MLATPCGCALLLTVACRNITITAALGYEAILDVNFARSAVELCSSCSVTFLNMTVANDRRGPGAAVDLFVGHPGSRVEFVNTNRFTTACAAAQDTGGVSEFNIDHRN